MRDLMFACVWLAILPVSFMSAHVGVLAWVWVALLSPNELLYGFMADLPLNKIAALATFGRMMFGGDRMKPYLDATLFLLVLLAIAGTITWLTGIVDNSGSEQLYEKLMKDIVVAFVIAIVMTTRDRIHYLVVAIALGIGFLGAKEGLIAILTAGGHKIIGSGSIGDNNSLATALLMVIPLLYYLATYSAVKAARIGFLSVLGLSVVTVIMTFSRGGFVGLLVLGAFMVKNSRNRAVSLLLVLFVGLAIYTLAPEAWFERQGTIEDANDDGSFMGRVVAWKLSWLIASDHPLFGGGFHAVQEPSVWTTYTQQFHLLDFIPTAMPDETPHAAHSIYFEVLGDMGFVGLTLFLGVLAVSYWNCRRIERLCRPHAHLRWAVDLARMTQISLVVYAITAAALSMAYVELFYIVVALVSRCRRTVEVTLAAGQVEQPGRWNRSDRAIKPDFSRPSIVRPPLPLAGTGRPK